MNGTSYEVSIFCSTHFYHPIANFPCEIKYNNKFKNVYPWIHYHNHIELFKIATLKRISRRRLATSNDYFGCSGYIERIHPLHLRYRNMFCCYTILMDVFPWPPNQLTHIHGTLCNNWLKRIYIFKNRMAFAMFSVRVYPFLCHMLAYSCKAVTGPWV